SRKDGTSLTKEKQVEPEALKPMVSAKLAKSASHEINDLRDDTSHTRDFRDSEGGLTLQMALLADPAVGHDRAFQDEATRQNKQVPVEGQNDNKKGGQENATV